MKQQLRKKAMACIVAMVCAFTALSTFAQNVQGPSSSQTSYLLPSSGSSPKFTSILTTTDGVPQVGGGTYNMAGIPDGLGAFDNGDGTFTVLMNQEIGNTLGVTRAHGAKGAFVSRFVVRKSDLTVLSGEDLMKTVYSWNSTTQAVSTPITFAFNRFCSADLPAVSAYYNASSGLGTQERIFMHGEEGGSTGYQLGTVVTGSNAGNAYILGKFNLTTNGSNLTGVGAWENALANPYQQDLTVVAANNDGGTGIMANSVSVYVGTKTNTGTEVDKAGLTNGTLYFVNVAGNSFEIPAANATTRATNITNGTAFTLSGTASTTFSRPEDGCWNPLNPNQYFFVTTDRLDQVADGVGAQVGRSRLWRLTFTDITNPTAGGTIDLLLDGTEGQNMFDNMCADNYGHLILQEDVGNAAHNGKIWWYDIATDALTMIAKHDPARFGDIGVSATSPFNQDEETSGVIDVSSILGAGMFLTVDQAHYATGIPTYAVEGGQLLAFSVCNVSASASAGTISCNGGTTSVTVSGSGGIAPYTGTGTFTVGAGTYNYTVTDAIGCTATTSVNISEPTALVASSSAGSISCNGGSTSVTVSAMGGTAPYSGTGTFTVSAGTYNYTVTDANGCSSNTSVTVSEPTVLVASSSAGSISCNGGSTSVTVSATGGTAPYSGTGTFTVSAGAYNYTVTDANGCTATTSVSVTEPTALVASSSAGTISCSGVATSLIVSASGGTAPYSGTGTFSSLGIGTYQYTVTDANGCSSATSVTVIQQATLVANATATAILCNGGKATVTVSATGGTSPYTGTGTFTNVAPGTYTYNVTDANGCTSSKTITITQPTKIVVTLNVSGAIGCKGGTTTMNVSASGGTPPYTGTGNFNVAAGSKTYTVTDANGCTGTANFNLNDGTSTAPTATPGAINVSQIFNVCSTNITCSIVRDVTNAAFYTWTAPAGTSIVSGQGTKSIELSVSGSFVSGTVSVIASNACGSGPARVSKVFYGKPSTPLISGPVCFAANATGLAFNVANPESGVTYSWTVSPKSATITSGQNSPSITVNWGTGATGTIRCIPSNSCGSGGRGSLSVATGCIATAKPSAASNMILFPNPTNNVATVLFTALKDSKYTVLVSDVVGKMLERKDINASVGQNKVTLDMTKYTSGTYMISLIDENGKIVTRQLVKVN